MEIKNSYRRIRQQIPIEAVIWISALILLMINNPAYTSSVSLCPFHNIGLDFCPGCGLGTSISHAFRGQFEASLNTHPLGIVAILILSSRIFTLFRRSFKETTTQREKNHG